MITKDVNIAMKVIAEGRIVAFPTGTSYGLAADATRGFALQRLRNLKKRLLEKSFTVFMREELWPKYLDLTAEEEALLKKYAGQKLTLLVKPKQTLEHLAQDGLVGLRVIDHPLMADLAQAASVPLTATSANVSNEEPCFTPDSVTKTFPGRLDETTYDLSLGCILDGGELPPSKPSTIAKVVNGYVEIVRQGALEIVASY